MSAPQAGTGSGFQLAQMIMTRGDLEYSGLLESLPPHFQDLAQVCSAPEYSYLRSA